jgi:hypothetical protein
MLSTKFQFIWESGFREDFLESEKRMACGGRFVSKHGCHTQFLFQIGRFLKIIFLETA